MCTPSLSVILVPVCMSFRRPSKKKSNHGTWTEKKSSKKKKRRKKDAEVDPKREAVRCSLTQFTVVTVLKCDFFLPWTIGRTRLTDVWLRLSSLSLVKLFPSRPFFPFFAFSLLIQIFLARPFKIFLFSLFFLSLPSSSSHPIHPSFFHLSSLASQLSSLFHSFIPFLIPSTQTIPSRCRKARLIRGRSPSWACP
jgi:hypothetical protein